MESVPEEDVPNQIIRTLEMELRTYKGKYKRLLETKAITSLKDYGEENVVQDHADTQPMRYVQDDNKIAARDVKDDDDTQDYSNIGVQDADNILTRSVEDDADIQDDSNIQTLGVQDDDDLPTGDIKGDGNIQTQNLRDNHDIQRPCVQDDVVIPIPNLLVVVDMQTPNIQDHTNIAKQVVEEDADKQDDLSIKIQTQNVQDHVDIPVGGVENGTDIQDDSNIQIPNAQDVADIPIKDDENGANIQDDSDVHSLNVQDYAGITTPRGHDNTGTDTQMQDLQDDANIQPPSVQDDSDIRMPDVQDSIDVPSKNPSKVRYTRARPKVKQELPEQIDSLPMKITPEEEDTNDVQDNVCLQVSSSQGSADMTTQNDQVDTDINTPNASHQPQDHPNVQALNVQDDHNIQSKFKVTRLRTRIKKEIQEQEDNNVESQEDASSRNNDANMTIKTESFAIDVKPSAAQIKMEESIKDLPDKDLNFQTPSNDKEDDDSDHDLDNGMPDDTDHEEDDDKEDKRITFKILQVKLIQLSVPKDDQGKDRLSWTVDIQGNPAPPKAGRGRPRKRPLPTQGNPAPPKPIRGRPRKRPLSTSETTTTLPIVAKKSRPSDELKWYLGTEFRCRLCAEMFYDSFELIAHAWVKHELERRDYKRKHGPYETREVLYQCQICQMSVQRSEFAIEQ